MTFSVVTPTWNCAPTVTSTIQSVMAQECDADIEHLLIDGASTDKTVDTAIACKSPYLKVFSEADKGIYDAFNKGVERASGQVISILNADDWYFPDTFSTVNDLFGAHPEIDFIHGNIEVLKGNVSTIYCPRRGLASLEGARVYHPTVFVRSCVFQKVGLFDLTYPLCADLDRFIRCQKAGYTFYYLNKTMTHFALGGASTTRRGEVIREVSLILKKHGFPSWQRWSVSAIEHLRMAASWFRSKV